MDAPKSRPLAATRIFKWPLHRLPALVIFLHLLLIINQVPNAQGLQQQVGSSMQPTITKNMNQVIVKENTPVGQYIYTLEAVGDGQSQIIYGIEGTRLFSVDKLTGQVRIAQLIDREQTSDSVDFVVTATPLSNNTLLTAHTARVRITVLIRDENDNPPRIERVKVGRKEYDSISLNRQLFSSVPGAPGLGPVRVPIIRLNVSESTPISSTIVDLIEAIDVDQVSDTPLISTCLDCPPEFRLQSITNKSLNDRLNSSIVLIAPLVHVPRNNVRQLNVAVSDDKFTSSIVFEITIEDVQNKPPQFIGSTTSIVQENAPIDKTIMTIQAIDGDAIGVDDVPSTLTPQPGRQILYELVNQEDQAPTLYEDFKLNPLTGQLQIANRLNREAYLTLNGVLTLRIRARELMVRSDMIVRNDDPYDTIIKELTPHVDSSPDAVSEVDITVIVIDVNDNEPHWLIAKEIASLNINQSPDWYSGLPNDRDTGRTYEIRVKENAIAGTPITTKNEMFVYDLDDGANSRFNISISDPFNLFDVEPKQAIGFAHVTLKIANGIRKENLLDYENPNQRKFIIELFATEIDTQEHHTSKATVHIEVEDVNDNAPEFREPFYIANIREDAPAGKTVLLVQANDKDEVSRQLSYSLHGRSAHLFNISRSSGVITVARCDSGHAPSMRKGCIDYEQQKSHPLVVEVSDGDYSTKVPLTIFIDDVSDNPPVFSLPVVDVVIEEGSDRLEPPIKIEATDIDQSSVLSYSIVEGNFEGLFSINNSTGELQLTRPIRINHNDRINGGDYRQQQLNKMTLVVQATDGVSSANGTIRIDVLDANDNAPEFVRSSYYAEITESALPGQPVLSVLAIDADRGNNARVSYKIQRGSFGLFDIDESTGAITVSKLATGFDASQRKNYTLKVVAYDHGLVSKSSNVTVTIHVQDTLSDAPKFYPQVQRATIVETTLNNTIIHRMTVLGQTSQTMLIFEPGPIEALDKNGQPVISSDRLNNMFSVSRSTGDVVVNSDLDHDYAFHINLTVYVKAQQQYMGSEPTDEDYNPRSVGYLLIDVEDDNSNSPIFASPWSPQQPELSYQMLEELPVGSVLAQLVASDVDSKISHYKIDPPNEYFDLTSPQSGVIVNKKLIDYDALMSQTFLKPGSHRSNNFTSSSLNNIIQFNVYVFDSGLPQLSAKATVSVEILPLNDWDCKFEQPIYEVHLKENALPDTLVIQVRAIDMDYGEQHNAVKYQLLGELSDYFNIDSRTGMITVSTKGSLELDRERLSRSTFTLTVLGRDEQLLSQGTSNVRPRTSQHNVRSCSSTIKIHVDDVNDNPPLFAQRLYEVTAYDTDVVDVPLVKLLIRDGDASASGSRSVSTKSSHSTNHYKIISGNTNDAFNITNSGIIYVTKRLNETQLSSNGQIELRVQVKQQSSNLAAGALASLTDECIVRINPVKINRYGPEWRLEAQGPITVKENARPGTLVTKLKCIDRDLQDPKLTNRLFDDEYARSEERRFSASSPIRYWIKENASNLIETKEFKLDPVTGNLYTRVELDREKQDVYQLVVACEDNGKPISLESVLPIYIGISDVDDNKPEFVVSTDQSQSRSIKGRAVVSFSVEEHQSKGLLIGELKAIDRDTESRIPISYCLLEGNEFHEFVLDRVTGFLYTNQTLDREKQASYDLLIKAINDGSSCSEHMINSPFNSKDLSANKTTDKPSKSGQHNQALELIDKKRSTSGNSFLTVKIEVLDINDNAPVFRKPVHRAGVHHRSLMNTLVTQVAAFDPDSELNGTLSYKISEILMFKTAPVQQQNSRRYDVSSEEQPLSKPIKLIHFPFKIDQQGNIYTQQLLTQYQLMSMFVLQIEATEQAEPWRTARTKLEIYVYETGSQLKIRINLHPRIVEVHRSDIETLLSNATKYIAIINRARSYHGTFDNLGQQTLKMKNPNSQGAPSGSELPTLSLTPNSNNANDEPNYSNIHLIFVDNHRIVNPNIVMEKFDLTSAQLFMPQMLTQLTDANNNNLDNLGDQRNNQAEQHQRLQINELSSLIDKVALASVQASEYHSSPSKLVGIDWLENPSILYVTLTAILVIIGFLAFLVGCCCTSRIKDHIIKVAMDKLVRQQNLQAKINEQVIAATNQVTMSSNNRQNSQEYMLHQGGFMSSFDATKGCISNNNENMNILQRAMESGEFIDPNYSSLNGQVNMGAHYYDTSELDQPQANGNYHGDVGPSKRLNDSNGSGSIGDEIREDGSDLMVGLHSKKSKLLSNGVNNQPINPRSQRQQVPGSS